MFIDDFFANFIGMSVFLGFVELVVLFVLLVLIIRFLWMVPDDLRGIKEYLRKFYNRDNSFGSDVSRVHPDVTSRIQQSVEEDFNNSSTLQ